MKLPHPILLTALGLANPSDAALRSPGAIYDLVTGKKKREATAASAAAAAAKKDTEDAIAAVKNFNRDLQTNANGCWNIEGKTPAKQWHPTYAAGWTNGYCRETIDCNSPGYPTELACCKGAYAGQNTGFCLSQLPNPPTPSPTDAGGLDVYYPDYDTPYADAYCKNERPMPNGRPTYDTMLACCKGAYPDQQSGICLSMLPTPPTGSPTNSAYETDFWYPTYDDDYAEGTCSNKLPLPYGNVNDRPNYETQLECCKAAYPDQMSGKCLSELEEPPTTSPTGSGGAEFYYPDTDSPYASATCINSLPLPFGPGGRTTYQTKEACCNGFYSSQFSKACICSLDNPPKGAGCPTSSPTPSPGNAEYEVTTTTTTATITSSITLDSDIVVPTNLAQKTALVTTLKDTITQQIEAGLAPGQSVVSVKILTINGVNVSDIGRKRLLRRLATSDVQSEMVLAQVTEIVVAPGDSTPVTVPSKSTIATALSTTVTSALNNTQACCAFITTLSKNAKASGVPALESVSVAAVGVPTVGVVEQSQPVTVNESRPCNCISDITNSRVGFDGADFACQSFDQKENYFDNNYPCGACVGRQSCTFAPGTEPPFSGTRGSVGANSCVQKDEGGKYACVAANPNAIVGSNSCSGNEACAAVGAIKIGNDSCNAGPNPDGQYSGKSCAWSQGNIGNNSCIGKTACASCTLSLDCALEGVVGNDSCIGPRSCEGAKGTIRDGSCIGVTACSPANVTDPTTVLSSDVGDGSCIGPDSCRGAKGTIGDGSCIGENDAGACFPLSISDPTAVLSANVGNGSCNGDAPCLGAKGVVGNMSCNGVRACSNNYAGAVVGSNSCTGVDTCHDVQGNIGNNSCNGDFACSYIGANDNIGKNSCNGEKACSFMGADVTVADGNCNAKGACSFCTSGPCVEQLATVGACTTENSCK